MTATTAYYGEGIDISLNSDADLSSSQFFFVKAGTTGVTSIAAATDQPLGVVQNKPKLNEVALVRIFGPSKIAAAGTIAIFANVYSNSAGKAVTAASGGSKYPQGPALMAMVSGDIGTLLVNPSQIQL